MENILPKKLQFAAYGQFVLVIVSKQCPACTQLQSAKNKFLSEAKVAEKCWP